MGEKRTESLRGRREAEVGWPSEQALSRPGAWRVQTHPRHAIEIGCISR